MKANMNQALQEWAMGAHNNGLLTIAYKFKNAGYAEADAIMEMQAFYDTIDTADKRDSHHKEVERAFHKAYETEFIPSKQKNLNVSYKEEQRGWRSLQSVDTELLRQVKSQDVRGDRIQTKTVLKELFRNCAGRVSQGENVADISWMETMDGFKDLKPASKYLTMAVFGDMVNDELQKEEDTRGGKKVHYERTDENVVALACLLMEFDAPMGSDMGDKDFDQMPEAEKKKVVASILEDTCLVLDRAGLVPTSITFSGHKSWHCLFRLKKPLTKADWVERLNDLKDAYRRLGADEKILTPSRATRMPLGTTLLNAQLGECQRLVYFNPDAEVDFSDFCDRVVSLADMVATKVEEEGTTIPMRQKIDKTGSKWVYDCTLWEKFLEDIRIKKAYYKDANDEMLIVSNEMGIFRIVKPMLALNYEVMEIKKVNADAAAYFREQRASKLAQENMAIYADAPYRLKLPKDTREQIVAPFRNGLLVIRKNDVVFNEGTYCNLDIPFDTQTLKRGFALSVEKSEFETFLEHACGSVENNPEWQSRKHSIMSLIGYMLCRKKEELNYLNILTEETETENQGGTGKSIIMKSIQYWRKRFFKDMKRLNEQTQRFMWSGLKPFTDYAQLDDLPRGANLELFFSASTDQMEIERKGKDEAHLDFEDAPKFILGTNYFPKGDGNSFYRRFKFFELSNHYCATITPAMEFGHQLFDGWTDEEWVRFDNFFISCAQTYLRDGLCECKCSNLEQKRIYSNMAMELADWIEQCVVSEEMMGVQQYPTEWVKGYFKWYQETYGTFSKSTYTKKYMKTKVKEYCETRGYLFDDATTNVGKLNGKSERYVIIDIPAIYKTIANTSTNPKNVESDSNENPENSGEKASEKALNEHKNYGTKMENENPKCRNVENPCRGKKNVETICRSHFPPQNTPKYPHFSTFLHSSITGIEKNNNKIYKESIQEKNENVEDATNAFYEDAPDSFSNWLKELESKGCHIVATEGVSGVVEYWKESEAGEEAPHSFHWMSFADKVEHDGELPNSPF